MHIGYFCYSLSGAGPRVRARTVISAIADRTDHEVTLVTNTETNFSHDDVNVYPILSEDIYPMLRNMIKTRNILSDCDIVHVPVNIYQLIYVTFCKVGPRVAGAGIQHEPQYRYLTRLLNVDLMIETHDQVAELWQQSGVESTYIYPAIDREVFTPQPDAVCDTLRTDLGIPKQDTVLLFVGCLKRTKGAELIAALPERIDDSTISLVVVGDGELQEKFTDRDDLTYVGFVENEDLPKYYSMADVTLVPSRKESFSIVSLESIACGTPVVTTTRNDCDMARIFKGTGTYTWTDRDVKSLASVSLELAHDRKRYRNQVQQSFETIESMGLSIEDAIEKYLEAYRVVQKRPSNP